MPTERGTAYQGVARLRKFILVVPLLVALLPIVALALLCMGQWVYGLAIAAIVFILNWKSETFPLHDIGTRIKGSDVLRLMTYNVNRAHSFSVNEGTTQGLVRFILRQDADIILLQEYNHLLYPEVRELLSEKYPYGLESEGKNDRFKSVFSRYPIEDYEQLWVNADDPKYKLFQHAWYCNSRDDYKEVLPICSMVVRVGNIRIRIVNCHLMSNNFSVVLRNNCCKGRSLLKTIILILSRMDFGYAVRKLQADVVVGHISKCPENSVIVCGDFNDINGSSTLLSFRKIGLQDAWWKRGIGYGFTFHGMKLKLRLDHVLFKSKNTFKLKGVFTPHSCVSDHYPLITDFTLR